MTNDTEHFHVLIGHLYIFLGKTLSLELNIDGLLFDMLLFTFTFFLYLMLKSFCFINSNILVYS